MDIDNKITPLKVEKGRAFDEYKAAAERLGRVSMRLMGDMRQLRSAAADVYIRQAEVAALVEIMVELKHTTTDAFLRRVADCMQKTATRLERQATAIHLPGRG